MWLAIILIAIGAVLRLLPHIPNFAPIGAIALFSGTYLPKKLALIVPLLAMVVSDIFIGYYAWPLMVSVYSSFLLSILLGTWLKKNKKWKNVLGASLLSSFLFFIITNLAVFLFTPLYPKTLSGLAFCYYMALPFFRNTIAGDLFFTFAFFGIYQIANNFWERKALA